MHVGYAHVVVKTFGAFHVVVLWNTTKKCTEILPARAAHAFFPFSINCTLALWRCLCRSHLCLNSPMAYQNRKVVGTLLATLLNESQKWPSVHATHTDILSIDCKTVVFFHFRKARSAVSVRLNIYRVAGVRKKYDCFAVYPFHLSYPFYSQQRKILALTESRKKEPPALAIECSTDYRDKNVTTNKERWNKSNRE